MVFIKILFTFFKIIHPFYKMINYMNEPFKSCTFVDRVFVEWYHLPRKTVLKEVLTMKITAVVENTSCRDDIGAEHGLSIYVKTKSHNLLFDVGKTDLFLKNAQTLGIDIGGIDTLIISHGHYDHGGGLSAFLEHNKKAKIYISEHAFLEYFAKNDRYIGLDQSLKNNPRFIFTKDELRLDDELYLFSGNNLPRDENGATANLYIKQNGEMKEDQFLHEQYLIITEDDKSVAISGCSHKGIINVSKWCERFSPNAIIGGFHFMEVAVDECGENLIKNTSKTLLKNGAMFYTCHCTGLSQYELFSKYMGQKIDYLSAGKTIEI